MYELFKKYWKRFLLPLKLLIVFVAFYMIYQKFEMFRLSDDLIEFPTISKFRIVFLFFLMLLMSTLNWVLEISKWKILVASIQSISFFDSLVQSLSAHTVALFTPLKSGDFGVKTMYYKQSLFKKIIVLNFLGNLSQLLMTVFFGILGFYFYQHSIIKIVKFHFIDGFDVVVFCLFIAISFVILFLSVKKKLVVFKLISIKTHLQNLVLALLRYLIFSHQFILLLYIFKPNLNYLQTISAIFSIYLLAAIIPTLAIFDWVIKGSVGVLILSVLGFQVETILLVSMLIWIFNFALPALLGSYFVLTFPSAKILVND